jgi:hypothetical protein
VSQANVTSVPGIDFLWDAVSIVTRTGVLAVGGNLHTSHPLLRKGVHLIEVVEGMVGSDDLPRYHQLLKTDPTAEIELNRWVSRPGLFAHQTTFRIVTRLDFNGLTFVVRPLVAHVAADVCICSIRSLFLQD